MGERPKYRMGTGEKIFLSAMVGLPVIGILSAVTIPALLHQRDRARAKAAEASVQTSTPPSLQPALPASVTQAYRVVAKQEKQPSGPTINFIWPELEGNGPEVNFANQAIQAEITRLRGQLSADDREINSKVGIANEHSLSIIFETSDYETGSPKPQTTVSALLLDLQAKRRLGIDDILDSQPSAKIKLENLVQRRLQESYSNATFKGLQIHPPVVHLAKDGLVLRWQTGQLDTSQSDGMPEIKLPRSALAGIVAPRCFTWVTNAEIQKEVDGAQTGTNDLQKVLDATLKESAAEGIPQIKPNQLEEILPQPALFYPTLARIARIQGPINVEVEIAPTGIPTQAVAIDGPEKLQKAAEEWQMKRRFKPPVVNGKNQTIRVLMTINYSLKNTTP